jgi:osmotically-inducible protein OsmY/sporulation protein YlmC with PRC-barrel domain
MMPKSRQILTIGVPALTVDGRCGRLQQALLRPGHRRLVALVIRYGIVPPREVVVPMEQVAAISDVRVRLRLSRAELAQQPAYRLAARAEHVLSGPPPALVKVQYGSAGTSGRIIEVPSSTALAIVERQASLADGLIALRAGQPVWSGTQGVGRLDRLLLDSEEQVCQIVVRTSRMFGRRVLVPIDQVTRCDAQGVWLALDHAAFHRLPDYRADRAIAIDVGQALRDDELVRRLDYRSIAVTVGAGVVLLHGHATTPVSRARAERAARGVRGVLEVTNQIVTDGELQLAVAQALAGDERTRGHGLFVHVQCGVVSVSGEVSSAAARTAVETVATSVPQVRAVINNVEGADEAAAGDQRALFARIGQEVYTAETRLGQVERVIIHPRHRRVTALVVQGWMADPLRATAGSALDPPPGRERRLVIPTSAVREVTASAVLLDMSDDEALRYADLDPAAYALPAADWRPPYPYKHAEVLLEPKRTDTARGDSLGVSAKPEGVVGRDLGAVANESKHE